MLYYTILYIQLSSSTSVGQFWSSSDRLCDHTRGKEFRGAGMQNMVLHNLPDYGQKRSKHVADYS